MPESVKNCAAIDSRRFSRSLSALDCIFLAGLRFSGTFALTALFFFGSASDSKALDSADSDSAVLDSAALDSAVPDNAASDGSSVTTGSFAPAAPAVLTTLRPILLRLGNS